MDNARAPQADNPAAAPDPACAVDGLIAHAKEQAVALGLIPEICAVQKKNDKAAYDLRLSFFLSEDRSASVCKLAQSSGLFGLVRTCDGADLDGSEPWITQERYDAMVALRDILLDHWDAIASEHARIRSIRSALC